MNALVILILVARGDARDQATLGAVEATYELLGPNVQVEVREEDDPSDDERALALGRSLQALATIELTWDRVDRRQARVHLHFEPRPGFIDRVIGFNANDDPNERGRTIGFAVASMLPGRSSRPGAPVPTPPPTPTPTPSPTSTPTPVPTSATVPVPTPVASLPLSPSIEPAAKAPGRSSLTGIGLGSVDLAGTGAIGLGGTAGGWGGAASITWYGIWPLGLRLGGAFRSGQVNSAQATSLTVEAAAGLVWLPLVATHRRPFELGARLDVLAIREELTHFDADDPEPVREARWLPGADAAVEACWCFSPTIGLVGALGTEVAFGTTFVTVHGQQVTTIPPFRLVWQAGVRATF